MDIEEINLIAAIIIALVGVILFLCYRLKSLSDINKQLKSFLYSKIDEIDRLNKKLNERKKQQEATPMKEEYTPQFDYDNIPEQEHVVKTCKKCGKSGEYIGLDSNGLCFDCRQTVNLVTYDSSECKPNEKLFRKWYYSQSYKQIFPKGLYFYRALLYLFRRIFLNHKMRELLELYNSLDVKVNGKSWRCPCCGSENVGFTHCGVCGVLPKFTEKE